MLWAVLFGLLLLVSAYQLRPTPRIHRNGKRLSRPKDSLPIFGNAIRFLQPRHVLFDWFVQRQREFGNETYEISVPTLPPGVVISGPENLEFVMKNEPIFTKGDFFRKRTWDLFGHGIINATSDLWRAQRKAGLKFFSGSNLDLLIEDVLPEAYQETMARLHIHSKSGERIDLQKIFLDLTTKVVGQMAYDMDISSDSPFSLAFDYASTSVSYRFQNPIYNLTELLTPSGSRFRAALTEVHRFGRQIVTQARKRRGAAAFDSLMANEPAPVFGSLIDGLLESFNDSRMVADAAVNFLSAGRDTTAQSLTWMFYALMRHPEVMEKVRREVDGLFPTEPLTSSPDAKTSKRDTVKSSPRVEDETNTGASPNGLDENSEDECTDDHDDDDDDENDDDDDISLTISALQPSSIPYTIAVFYETLRLYPPVPLEIKQSSSTTPITLPADSTTLPPNTVVVWCLWAINRSEKIWGADAHAFRPERWLDLSNNNTSANTNNPNKAYMLLPKEKTKSPFEFPVFNGGPRACLGKKMAELMAAWVVVKMVREFEFVEQVETHDGEGKPKERVSQSSLTLPMEGGLPCLVRTRKGRTT